MTHIAATTKTSILGTGSPAAKGAPSADGTDFAAVVAGLTDAAAPTGEDGAALLSDDAGKGSGQGAGTGDGSDATPQQPVVQDLALTAAAQSAVADMVVTPPVQIIAAPASTETAKATEAVALDTGATRIRTGWRPTTTAPTAPRTTAVQTAAKDAVADPAAQPETTSKAESTAPASVTDLLSRIANAMPRRTAPTQASGAKGSAATTSKIPAAATPAPMAAATASETSGAPSTATIIPIVRDGAQPATAPEAAPATSETPAPMAIADLLRQRLAPFSQATPAQRDTVTAAPVVTGAETPVAATPATASAEVVAEIASTSAPSAPTLVRPVMSALHRTPATPAAEATTAQAATASPSNGTDAQTGQDSGSKDGKDSPATATPRSAPAERISLASDDGARPFAEIVQTPPPVAQGGVGAVGDASSIGATTDVGAGLQNSVIDMSVGGQWIDRVAREITNLAEGTGHSRFQLSPPHLGRIQIDVWQGGEGEGRVQMLTETTEAAQRLRDGQSSLQADARLAALSLGNVTIVHAAGGLDQGGNQDAPRQQNGDANAFSQQQQPSQQGNGQSPSHQQNWGTSGGQLGQNAGQSDGRSGNSSEQGKSSLRRDVLDRDAGTAAQDGGPAGRTGDRLVRYA